MRRTGAIWRHLAARPDLLPLLEADVFVKDAAVVRRGMVQQWRGQLQSGGAWLLVQLSLLMCVGTKGDSSLASHLAALSRATSLVAMSPTSSMTEP